MPQHEPASPEQLAERREIIRNMITAGFNQAEVVRRVKEEYGAWGVSDRQVRNYVKAVYEDFSSDAGLVDRRAYFVRTIESIDQTKSEAAKIGNLKLKLDCDLAIARLLKLDSPQANMDWREAAKNAGLEPTEMVKQFADLFNKGTASDIRQ